MHSAVAFAEPSTLAASVQPAKRPKVLFVTDELFFPPHNGSSQVYINTALEMAAEGAAVFCVSACRDLEQAARTEVRAAYQRLFSGFLAVPGNAFMGSWLGCLGVGLREIARMLRGDVFAATPLLRIASRRFERAILDLVERHGIDTIHFHKPHTVLLLRHLLHRLRPATLVVELHDDFIERAHQYELAYASFFSAIGWRELARDHLIRYLRYRLVRFDAERSRETERALLAACDRILVASPEELERYRGDACLRAKLVYKPWRLPVVSAPRTARERPRFNAGLIGSDDVMNLDALVYFCRTILPRIREREPAWTLLIAGSVAKKAERLVRGTPGITVWGRLDNVRTFYDAIGVAVIPLRFGSGVSIKTLEALGFGCPVVSTSIGVRGLPPTSRRQIAVADDPASFAEAALNAARRTRS